MSTDRTTEHDPLAALGAHLSARRLKVDLTADGLKVANPAVPGCCAEVAHASDTITCRRRPEDGGARWFYSSWREPIAPVDNITDTALYVLGYLNRCAETFEAGS
jgi:hypothetical protein